ncbi:MAG: LOG family protein [Ktedonobacteraceae bacterium]
MHRICVFTGSNPGTRPEYQQSTRSLAQAMVARGLGLVYGGASVGLMGVLADTVLAGGGEVLGVIPRGLFRQEVPHRGLTRLHEVASMHERKALMADLSDGFIALPGGFGTFDELFEIITWAQLGLHNKPIGVINVAGYFDLFFALVVHASAEGFIPSSHQSLLMSEDNAMNLLDRFAAYTPQAKVSKWSEIPPER